MSRTRANAARVNDGSTRARLIPFSDFEMLASML